MSSATVSSIGPSPSLSARSLQLFSAVLSEGSDDIQFQYYRYSANGTNCNSSTLTRGSSATIGVQGSGVATAHTSMLTAHNAACPGLGYQISLKASVPNPLSSAHDEGPPGTKPTRAIAA